MEEYRHDSCADKGCRASVIKKHRIDNDVKTVDVHATGSLENRRKEREHAHVQASKTLKDMHTKLMTPQLILSAVTSTLAAKTIYRPCRTNSDGGRCDCMYGTRRDHQFRRVQRCLEDTASQQRDTDRFTDIWEVSILSMRMT
jgi:hypothetical protein